MFDSLSDRLQEIISEYSSLSEKEQKTVFSMIAFLAFSFNDDVAIGRHKTFGQAEFRNFNFL